MPNGLSKRLMIRAMAVVFLGLPFCLPESLGAKETHTLPPSPAYALDQKKIHQAYTEGDFDRVIASIDSFTQANTTFSQSDSVFIAKHLAVIYTANPRTREKGKNYMFRLLSLLPSAKIVDMFVSDEIDHIFQRVREEYVIRQETLGQAEPTKTESNQFAANKLKMTAPNESVAKPKKGFSQTLYWVAGGVTLAAIGGTAIYLLQSDNSADKVYDLPK